MIAVTAPRSIAGGSGQRRNQRDQLRQSRISHHRGPMTGMANPPSWLNRLFGRATDAFDRQGHRT